MQLGDFTEIPSILAAMKTDELFSSDGDYDGPHCTVKEGMSTLMEPLMAQVGDHVHLNQQVLNIQEVDCGVRLETQSGMVVEADCCVVTVPVGCLKASSSELFHPPLPAEKIEAINAMSTGVYKKILLTFDRIFWPADETFVGFIRRSSPDGIGKNLMVYNLWAHRDIPCMEAVLFGNAGKWAINQSDETIRNAILEFLEEAMGLNDIKGWCVDCHVTRWEEDPFTRGSYTSFSLGTSEHHVETLQRSEWNGRLIFAGVRLHSRLSTLLVACCTIKGSPVRLFSGSNYQRIHGERTCCINKWHGSSTFCGGLSPQWQYTGHVESNLTVGVFLVSIFEYPDQLLHVNMR